MSVIETASTTTTLVNTNAVNDKSAKTYTTQRDCDINYTVAEAQEASQLSYMHIYDKGSACNIVARYDGSYAEKGAPITSTVYMDQWKKDTLAEWIQVTENKMKVTINGLVTYFDIMRDVERNNRQFKFTLFDGSTVTIDVYGNKYEAVGDKAGFVYASAKQSVRHAIPLMGHKYAAMTLHHAPEIDDNDSILITTAMLYTEARLRGLHSFVEGAKRRNMKQSGDSAMFMGGHNWAEKYK
ncbi:hypothetical protein E3Q16_00044 [Wallemia mellicola]|nr:hypothetical protein E3Q16_00044 [Wallemia mellicola]